MVRVDVVIEGQEEVGWHDWTHLAEACEHAGIAGLFTSDHYLSEVEPARRGALDAWSVMAGLAAVTERVRLGTVVTPVTFRHPSVIAKLAVSVDHISNGRVELGLGAGWYEREHRAYGFHFPPLRERIRLLRESLEIIRGLTSDGTLEHGGSCFQLVDCPGLPKPVQRRLPIIVGGTGKPGTVRCAAEFADEYNSLDSSLEGCSRVRARLDQACEAIGRQPASLPMSLSLKCVTGSTEADIDRRLQRAYDLLLLEPSAARPSIDEGWLVGTADVVAAQLRELAELKVTRVFLRLIDHLDLEVLEVLGHDVIPALSAA